MIPTELAPQEDQGIIIAQSTAQPNASIDQLETWMREQREIYQSFPETQHVFLLNGLSGGSSQARSNTAIAGMNFKPWTERERTSMEVKPLVQQKLGGIAGVQAAAFIPPPLPGGGGGLPVQFVVGSIEDPRQVYEFSQQILGAALKSPKFVFAQSDLKYDRGEVNLKIDRTKARSLGIDMRKLGVDLASMLGGGDVNRFALQGRSYKVIPQVVRAERVNAEQILDYRVRTKSGDLVPVSTFVSLERVTKPRKLNRFQQLNAATISALPAPGVSMGEAVGFFQNQADRVLPPDYTVDYAGASRQYVQEGSALVFTFFFALITIYLVLSAQFESFRDPLIMLVSVPMSISGALAFMALGYASMNVYTQIGLVTLIGVISKHGILLVQFANQLQEEGHDKRTAIEHAAGIRLRPILMTTAALVFAMVPLLIAQGPGAVSRFHIGVVIAAGMTIGTVFTLYVVPAIYTFVARTRVGGASAAT
jgi:multidrug efflux pump